MATAELLIMPNIEQAVKDLQDALYYLNELKKSFKAKAIAGNFESIETEIASVQRLMQSAAEKLLN
ncbi:hypothetical protein HYV82_04535 [Candidatus Woesearchaeota archaeon]|nr:hypothetical protein [Candidatus Woesearchaeota archaeon]